MDYAHVRPAAEGLARHTPEILRGLEISGDSITFSMPPPRRHDFTALRIRQELDSQLPPTLLAHTRGEVEDPSLGTLRRPDVIVVPETAFDEATTDPFAPREVVLVAEVVSASNPTTDYVEKARGYAAMGIAYYLVVDPRESTFTAFSGPGPTAEGPRYRAQHNYAFGSPVTLDPWTLQTTELRLYQAVI